PEASGSELADNATGNTGSISDNGAAANPDDMPRTDLTAVTTVIEAKDAGTAAWMTYIQALYASAEFRFIR
ncbi:MAG TPA: hypothetical protein VGE67_10740, partial [Haloferula sp.]